MTVEGQEQNDIQFQKNIYKNSLKLSLFDWFKVQTSFKSSDQYYSALKLNINNKQTKLVPP